MDKIFREMNRQWGTTRHCSGCPQLVCGDRVSQAGRNAVRRGNAGWVGGRCLLPTSGKVDVLRGACKSMTNRDCEP